MHVFEQWALPPDCTASAVLHDGQTCPSVAQEYGTTVEDLYELNSGAVPDVPLRTARMTCLTFRRCPTSAGRVR